MDEILNDFSAQALTAAIEANLLRYYRYIGRSDHVELNDDPDLTRFITGIPHPFMNGFFCKHLTTFDTVEETLKILKSRKVPFLCWIGSDAKSEGWRTQLEAYGLVYDEEYTCMAADLLALNEEFTPPASLTIEQVENKNTLEHWVNSALIGFGLSSNRNTACFDLFVGLEFDKLLCNFLGLIDGKPVATSQLFLAAGVAGIYWVTTIPEVRRQGIGMAMTLAPLQEARSAGYRIGVLHPSEMGRGVYRRLGFKDHGILSHGMWIPKTTDEIDDRT
jgi:GNAT superfamily N-acetyltransferase